MYAERNNIEYKEYYPQYDKCGRAAPIIRNKKIIEYSDEIAAFLDGQSKGTKNVIDYCNKIGKKLTVV